jgi:hypothetical protein
MTLLIGNKGKVNFLAPFDKYNSDREWSIVGIQQIPYLLKLGADILELVYISESLAESDFNNDILNKVPIVTLENESQELINVPMNRIGDEDVESSYRYKEYGLAVALPALPIDYDTTALENDIKTVVKEKLGFDVPVEKVELSAITLVNSTKHKDFLLHLQNGIISKHSWRTKYLMEVERNNKLTIVKAEALNFATRENN